MKLFNTNLDGPFRGLFCCGGGGFVKITPSKTR